MSFELNRRLAARREPLATTTAVDPVTASIIRGALENGLFRGGDPSRAGGLVAHHQSVE
jgi:hypothetical protein